MIEQLKISDVRIGKFLTAVRLSDGTTGTSASVEDELPFCAKSSRDFGDFSPLRIKGQNVRHLLESKKEINMLLSLKMAVINAVSSNIISSAGYRIIEDRDPIEFIDLTSGKRITIVGAFHSYIRKISGTDNRLSVLEIKRHVLPHEYRKFFVPAEEFRTILPVSDIVIITGQTLVNGTIDGLLEAITPGTQVIVTGPSSSILPDILFENKVSIIGAVRITDPDMLFEVVSQGGTGYHLFEYCARKICILKEDGEQAE